MDYVIIYFAFIGSDFGGVEQKIIAQFDALSQIRPNVFLYLVSSFSPKESLQNEIGQRTGVKVLINSKRVLKNPYRRRKEKFYLIGKILEQFDPTSSIVYMRYPNADFLLLSFLRKNKAFKIITEHQEIENTFRKWKFNGNYLRNFSEMIWGRKVRDLITGFVGVTPEITDYQLKICGNPAKPAITNGNGVKPEKYPVREPENSTQNVIKILFVGAGYKTHGLYRLIKSIYHYSSKNNIYKILLKIVGDSHEMRENKKLVKKFKLESSVNFLGFLDNPQTNDLYNWADIAVGSLAIHRKGLSFTSELKAREYFIRGIPFFWSIRDVDFPENCRYILNVPIGESAFDMDPVVEFALSMRNEKEHPGIMREYAERHLDWKLKMTKLVDYFDQIMYHKFYC